MNNSNPYEPPNEDPADHPVAPEASKRVFEFEGRLNYEDVYHAGKSPGAFSRFQVLSGYLLLAATIILLPVQQVAYGRSWSEAFRSVFLHPVSIAIFAIVGFSLGVWKYLVSQVKRQAQAGVGEFGKTFYQLCDDHLGWRYESVETRLQWDGVQQAVQTPEQLTLIMNTNMNSKLIFPRRWFDEWDWEQLNLFVMEKCHVNPKADQTTT